MADLAPPNAEAAVALLERMPNPAEAGRDVYTRVMFAARGCIQGLGGEGEDAIASAAVDWACRWPGSPGHEVEREKWERDFATRDRALAGWQNLLVVGTELGVDVTAQRTAGAASEFAGVELPPDTSEPGDWRSMLLLTEKGTARTCLQNAVVALRHDPAWRGVIAFDQFASKAFLRIRAALARRRRLCAA